METLLILQLKPLFILAKLTKNKSSISKKASPWEAFLFPILELLFLHYIQDYARQD